MGDDRDLLIETKQSLEQGVRDHAYLLWERDGCPEGRADEILAPGVRTAYSRACLCSLAARRLPRRKSRGILAPDTKFRTRLKTSGPVSGYRYGMN